MLWQVEVSAWLAWVFGVLGVSTKGILAYKGSRSRVFHVRGRVWSLTVQPEGALLEGPKP